ncbi:MAG: hypothetical protein WBF93_10475 [Pirellulales bacterium]
MTVETDFEMVAILLKSPSADSAEPLETIEILLDESVDWPTIANAPDIDVSDSKDGDENDANVHGSAEDSREADFRIVDTQNDDVGVEIDHKVRQICVRLHDAASGLPTNPMLAFIAADPSLRTTSGVRQVVVNLVDRFGDPVLLVDCSTSGLLAKTCLGDTVNGPSRSFPFGSGQAQILGTRYPGLLLWRTQDLDKTASDTQGAPVVEQLVEQLLEEFKLVVLFADISSTHGTRKLIKMSRGCVVFFSVAATQVPVAKKLRRRLKSWGTSLYGSVLIGDEAA